MVGRNCGVRGVSDGQLEVSGGENADNLRQPGSRCVHADAVIVNMVSHEPCSYSAHCLKCGATGPVRQRPEGARQAIWAHATPPEFGGGSDRVRRHSTTHERPEGRSMIRAGDQVRIRDTAETASARPYAGNRGWVKEVVFGNYGTIFLVVLDGDRSATAFSERDLLRHYVRNA